MTTLAFWSLGPPVLLPLGWGDVALAGFGIGLLAISVVALARARRTTDGPWCLRCDYCLAGLAAVAACPECGASPEERGAVKARPWAIAHLTWIAGTWLTTLLLLRAGPVTVSTFTDIHIYRHLEWEQQLDFQAKNPTFDRIIVLTPGYRIAWPPVQRPYDGVTLATVRRPLLIHVAVSEPTLRGGPSGPVMSIEPGTGAWLTMAANGHSLSRGSTINEEAIWQLFAAAGIDDPPAFADVEIPDLVVILRDLLDGHWSRTSQITRFEVSPHTPVGSRRPQRPWWWFVIAVAVGCVLLRRGKHIGRTLRESA